MHAVFSWPQQTCTQSLVKIVISVIELWGEKKKLNSRDSAFKWHTFSLTKTIFGTIYVKTEFILTMEEWRTSETLVTYILRILLEHILATFWLHAGRRPSLLFPLFKSTFLLTSGWMLSDSLFTNANRLIKQRGPQIKAIFWQTFRLNYLQVHFACSLHTWRYTRMSSYLRNVSSVYVTRVRPASRFTYKTEIVSQELGVILNRPLDIHASRKLFSCPFVHKSAKFLPNFPWRPQLIEIRKCFPKSLRAYNPKNPGFLRRCTNWWRYGRLILIPGHWSISVLNFTASNLTDHRFSQWNRYR